MRSPPLDPSKIPEGDPGLEATSPEIVEVFCGSGGAILTVDSADISSRNAGDLPVLDIPSTE